MEMEFDFERIEIKKGCGRAGKCPLYVGQAPSYCVKPLLIVYASTANEPRRTKVAEAAKVQLDNEVIV